ncbi:MAG: cation-translocating P-type ATPase [Chloroflexota bacterium]|nr:cation-translocating P-type ATPase [Chloroflexota bacterium]
MIVTTFCVVGLDCLECAKGLEASIAAMSDIDEARVQFFDGTLTVRGDVDDGELRKRVAKLGYSVADGKQSTTIPSDEPNVLRGFWRYIIQRTETQMVLVAALVLMPSLAFSWLGFPDWMVISLQIGALVLAGWPIARHGLVVLWTSRTFNINSLMTIAGIGAVVIGEYFEAASLILLFNLAEALEGFTNDRARGELRNLNALSPTHAVKLIDGHENLIPVEELIIGDHILARAGERIPMDGVILAGESDLNQAPITGESLPVWKKPGDEVYSGTVNGNGQLIVEVTNLVGDSTMHRIIEMVTEAQSRHSRSQKFIDRFARYYTPAMVILAVLVAMIPPLFYNEPFLNLSNGTHGWLYRALVLLVISCPCALVISTPVTMVASLTKAAREGVLFKGGIFVEALSKVEAFAFDKTGTLTQGQPKVVACKDLACQGTLICDDMMALAYALERHSTHPLAQAIIEEAERRLVTTRYPPAENLVTRGGLGLEGTINGRKMTIGSLRLFEEEHDIPAIVHGWVEKAESEGKTAMLVCDGEKVRGFIAVADTPRFAARDVVKELNTMGKDTIMLTGDNVTVARGVGKAIGLDDVRAGLLPDEKQQAVKKLRVEYGSVGMVGDGINDAPALASADLGIAMGGSGSAQAMETADIVLMADDIQKLPFAIKLSQFANRLIQQNIVFSLGSKLLVAVIALLGYAPLWLAVIADIGVSLLVTFNGLRVTRVES